MNVLVTGASGFIGSHLVERLVKEGNKVRVLVRKEETQRRDARKIDSLDLLRRLNIEIVRGDLLDLNSLKKAVEGVEIVFHLAAVARPMAIPDELYFKVNEQGTRNLLDACKTARTKIKKIVVMSSVSAVGATKNERGVNEKTECKPVDVYGMSKLAQEKVCEEYFKKYKMPIIILRPPMVFGPRDLEMLKLFKAVNYRFFPIDGKAKCMEFLYVGNLVEACLLAVKNGKEGEKYHISNGEHYSINEIIKSIEKVERKKIIPIKFPKIFFVIAGYFIEYLGKVFHFHPPFKHDTVKWMTEKFWYSDISKAKEELYYVPIFSLDEGIKRTGDYYISKGMIK